ncbi:MAG TPA: F0F1 ATP synthase subunit epsilon [Bryobacteraceae bacterium]|nr:F0F1 ATP synthase subunit epsilon [Bryobacteraceae bacterium]
MNTLVLHLQSGTQYERVEGITSFAGQDASGSFGILPGHERLMSLLIFGLARFRIGEEDWQYLAVPGALVYFLDNQLYLNTRRYVRGGDYEAIRATLRTQFMAEETELHDVKRSVQRLEEEMFKRFLEMNRGRSA